MTVKCFIAGINKQEGITIKPLDMKRYIKRMAKKWNCSFEVVQKTFAPPYDYIWCLAKFQNDIPSNYVEKYNITFKRAVALLKEKDKIYFSKPCPTEYIELLEKGKICGTLGACPFA